MPKDIGVQPLKPLNHGRIQPVLREVDKFFNTKIEKPDKMLPILMWIANYGMPSVFILFVAVYWIIGVSIYMK